MEEIIKKIIEDNSRLLNSLWDQYEGIDLSILYKISENRLRIAYSYGSHILGYYEYHHEYVQYLDPEVVVPKIIEYAISQRSQSWYHDVVEQVEQYAFSKN